MLPFFGAKSEKDIGERLVGKTRRFRLPRHGAAVTVQGKLLASHRHDQDPDGLMPPAAGRVELIALFVTRAGRYLVYYVVSYPETEDIAGRHEYVHVLESLAAVRAFLAAMQYPNRADFADSLVARALVTLEGGRAKGKGKIAAGPEAVTPEAPAQDAAVSEAAPEAAPATGDTPPADVPAPDAPAPETAAPVADRPGAIDAAATPSAPGGRRPAGQQPPAPEGSGSANTTGA